MVTSVETLSGRCWRDEDVDLVKESLFLGAIAAWDDAAAEEAAAAGAQTVEAMAPSPGHKGGPAEGPPPPPGAAAAPLLGGGPPKESQVSVLVPRP